VTLLGEPTSERTASDLRHLARSAAANAAVFATRDRGILSHGDAIRDELGLIVIHPQEVLARLDELRDASRYRPARLGGTNFTQAVLRTDEVEEFARALANRVGVPFGRLSAEMRGALADRRGLLRCVRTASGEPLAVCASVRNDDSQFGDVTLFYVDPNDALAPTIAATLLQNVVREERAAGMRALNISNEILGAHIASAVQLGFVAGEGRHTKFVIRGLPTAADVVAEARRTAARAPNVDTQVACVEATAVRASGGDLDAAAELDEYIWPAVLAASEVPSFIVPIKPTWAMNLFDAELSTADLFGGSPALLLRSENVYYRSRINSAGLGAPARILWYVSGGDHPGTASIRAISLVREVVVGLPRVLFRQFQRLGVYAWRDVFETANHDISEEIMAIRFGSTDAFERPIRFADVQAVLQSHGQSENPLASPVRVGKDVFDELVRRGRGVP
jgi:hypothetical protein